VLGACCLGLLSRKEPFHDVRGQHLPKQRSRTCVASNLGELVPFTLPSQ
jgi:hypothetical protein